MGGMFFGLLGELSITIDGEAVTSDAFERSAARDLVQLLALTPGRRLNREQVFDALWPDASRELATRRLYKAATYARRAIGRPSAVVVRRSTVELFPAETVSTDVEIVLGADLADPEAVVDALNLFRGPLLPDALYEEWTIDVRRRLAHRRLDLLAAAGRWEELAELEPGNEWAHVELMRASARTSDWPGVLRRYDELARSLHALESREPGAEARALREQALIGRPIPPRPGDAGPAKINRLTEPGETEANRWPLRHRTAESNESPPEGWPLRSPTIGRRFERSELVRLVGSNRLITVTGPPGVGKTQLALDVASAIGAGEGSMVGLAELGDMIDERAAAGLIDETVDGCGWDRSLVVLDNGDHLLDTIRTRCRHLLRERSELRFLLTSRSPLGLGIERCFVVRPLDQPTSVELFNRELVRRGVEPTADVEAVSELCSHLDGLPLAIGLAAERAATLGLAAVTTEASRGDDLRAPVIGAEPAHHGSLGETVDWSLALLQPTAQRVLFDLINWTGAFTIDEAIAVAHRPDRREAEVVDAVAGLVRSSLLLPVDAAPEDGHRAVASGSVPGLTPSADEVVPLPTASIAVHDRSADVVGPRPAGRFQILPVVRHRVAQRAAATSNENSF